MPGFADAIKKDFGAALREKFIADQEAKAPKRRPRRVGKKPAYGTMFALRNKRLAIRESAARLVQIIITYRKITTGETKKYVVAPYSYRYRETRDGRRKMLFAYDMKAKRIKGFALRHIRKVALTDRKYKPQWPVEIA
jgi:hypothetical protein